MATDEGIKARLRDRHAAIAQSAAGRASCCGGGPAAVSCCGSDGAADAIGRVGDAYAGVAGHVAEADLGLGCGVPTEHAGVRPGDVVLDLGAGAGVDAFIARRIVGEEGRVIGVDVTEAMVAKARANAARLGYANVEFRLGDIEAMVPGSGPGMADGEVDVAISNCVLNLVPDKARAYREIHRVLRPGGHLCVSDIVSAGDLPPAVREAAELHAGCVAGAMEKGAYLRVIEDAGFEAVEVTAERPIGLPDAALEPHLSRDGIAAFRAQGGGLLSVTVRARKPVAA